MASATAFRRDVLFQRPIEDKKDPWTEPGRTGEMPASGFAHSVVQIGRSPNKFFVIASANNVHYTLTDRNGRPLLSRSTGSFGFSGSRKSSTAAAATGGERMAQMALGLGVSQVDIIMRGVSPLGMAAVRGFAKNGIRIGCFTDDTPIPFNGCRPPKKRRL